MTTDGAADNGLIHGSDNSRRTGHGYSHVMHGGERVVRTGATRTSSPLWA